MEFTFTQLFVQALLFGMSVILASDFLVSYIISSGVLGFVIFILSILRFKAFEILPVRGMSFVDAVDRFICVSFGLYFLVALDFSSTYVPSYFLNIGLFLLCWLAATKGSS